MTRQSSHLSLPALAVLLTAGLLFGTGVGTAYAQHSDDVSVNLDALGLGQNTDAQTRPQLILKYPGSSTATRQVPQLRYPNVPAPTARPTPPPVAQTATPVQPEPAKPEPVAEAKPVEREPQNVAVVPTPAPDPDPEPAPEPVPTATPPAPAAPASAAPADIIPPAPAPEAQLAALAPPAPVSELPDPEPAILRVIFDEQTAAIIGSARKDLDAIGESLRYDPRRIELKAYGGEPGDKASEARRISLKRGLAVRAYLIGLGIDSRRIDVRALGGVTDTGAPDRVDVAYSGT